MRSKKDFTVIEISLIFGIIVSECPSIQQFHEPKDNQLTLEYGFKINQTAIIPFVNVHRQELILEMENGTGENKLFSLIWNNTSLDEKKSLDLPIDQKYYTSIRIVGFQELPDRSRRSTMKRGRTKITIDCPQTELLTYSWQCNDNVSIQASLVCDGEANCQNKEDEDPLLCLGSIPWLMAIISYSSLTFYFLGFVVYGVKRVLRYINKKEVVIESFQSNETEEDCLFWENAFKDVRTLCRETINQKPDGNFFPEGSTKLEPFIKLVTNCHSEGPRSIQRLCKIILDISREDEYQEVCYKLTDMIKSLENITLHHNNKDGSQCLKNSLSIDFRTANKFLDAQERDQFFSTKTAYIVSLLKDCFGTQYGNMMYYGSISLCILTAFKFVTNYHLDVYYDINFVSALDHIHKNFLLTDEKLKQSGNMDIGAVKYYYTGTSLLSYLVTFIYNLNYQKLHKYGECSLPEFILERIFLFFPAHCIAIRMMEVSLHYILENYNLKRIIKELMEEKKQSTNEEEQQERQSTNVIKNYFRKIQHLQKIWDDLLIARKIILGGVLIEVGIEGIPQFLVMFSIWISQVKNDFGQLRVIFDHQLKHFLGIDSYILYWLILILTIIKFMGNILPTTQMNR